MQGEGLKLKTLRSPGSKGHQEVEGLRVQGLGFRVKGLRFLGLGFGGLRFRVYGVQGLNLRFRVWGSSPLK